MFTPWQRPRRLLTMGVFGLLAGTLCVAGAASTNAAPSPTQGPSTGGSLSVTTVLSVSGASLTHTFTPAGGSPVTEPLSHPDDITLLGQDIFVGFQNGVGPQGQASTSGNLDSTVVEMTQSGSVLGKWDVAGKADGVTADPEAGTVVAAVNEDDNSSLYTITPGASSPVQHYMYNEPLPHNGGTDAISVFKGQLLISASAPGTTGPGAPQPSYPAVYAVSLDAADSVATVNPYFFDEDKAKVTNAGTPPKEVRLMLTDPDSTEVVPTSAPRFGGDFMLTSQGDQQQIFVTDAPGASQKLEVLDLSQSVDDTAWPDGQTGTLYSTDSTNDTVDAITGDFPAGPVVVATPCGSNSAPAVCPAPPTFPDNFLASLDPWTGEVTALDVTGVSYVPQGGLLFVPDTAG